MREWARRLRGEVAFTAMHPGWADTPGLAEALPGFHRVMRPVLRTPGQGIDTATWLATHPDPMPRSAAGSTSTAAPGPSTACRRPGCPPEHRRGLWDARRRAGGRRPRTDRVPRSDAGRPPPRRPRAASTTRSGRRRRRRRAGKGAARPPLPRSRPAARPAASSAVTTSAAASRSVGGDHADHGRARPSCGVTASSHPSTVTSEPRYRTPTPAPAQRHGEGERAELVARPGRQSDDDASSGPAVPAAWNAAGQPASRRPRSRHARRRRSAGPPPTRPRAPRRRAAAGRPRSPRTNRSRGSRRGRPRCPGAEAAAAAATNRAIRRSRCAHGGGAVLGPAGAREAARRELAEVDVAGAGSCGPPRTRSSPDSVRLRIATSTRMAASSYRR